MTRSRRLATFASFWLAAAAASATSYVLVADAPLADQAGLIAVATVADSRGGLLGELPATELHLDVERVVAGRYTGSRLIVRTPGGRSELTDRTVVLFGAPRAERGERLLLFLGDRGDGTFRILHFNQGIFHQVEAGGERLWLRDLGGESVTWQTAIVSHEGSTARHADRFEAWLDDRAAGLERPADYRVARPAVFGAAYTRLSDFDLRWLRFDEKRKVRWHLHRDGQPGLTQAQTRAAFRRARQSWRRQTGFDRLKLVGAGRTGSTTGFVRADFRNTILFGDVNDVIGDDFDCSTGGVIAIGGVSAILTTSRPWKGELFFPIDEAEIVVNDGAGCLLGSPDAAEQVWAHELGHTLGLGHSCGDDRSPACDQSATLDEALMRAFFHNDGRAAQLNADDIAGALTLYAPELFAAPCGALPPGHPKFCKECGPCGEGQGGCRNVRECRVGLTCQPGRGDEVGFDADTRVCLPPPF